MLQALFLLKQHVLPRVQDCEDLDRFADACPIVSEPCGVFSDNLRGVIRNVAKQFNKNNLVIYDTVRFSSAPSGVSYNYVCAYKYLSSCLPKNLVVVTPEMQWRRTHHHGHDMYKYVVPANGNKDAEFMKPILNAIWDAIYTKPNGSFTMNVCVQKMHNLPWTFSASITMLIKLKFSTKTNTLWPHMIAESVVRGLPLN